MYDVIYADPPWNYGSGGVRSGEYADLDYPKMTTKDLIALPVEPWGNDNAALFMWVTGAFMQEALECGKAWGFKFVRVDKVWVKKTAKGGRHAVVGPWGMTDAEFILLFVRGKMCSKQVQKNQFVVEAATYPGVHSRKPAIFRQMIEDRFPVDMKRLELFSREQVPGWTVIGNDIDGRDIREVLASLPANDNSPKHQPTPAKNNAPITYGSVCSGIEAASVAWEPLGWKPAWFAEIDPFPSAVLAHHWPAVPNLGDMTKIAEMVTNDNVPAPDILVGGTPCQAFSVAGLRDGLSDERGQLTLEYVRLADAIDSKRTAAGSEPAIIVWENVPGVLSSKDNAFGCFLAGLAGESDPLVAPGGKWANAGCVFGPSRAIAWRILDAQYFGVAQRRRRVFLVASARAAFDPTAVLFEFDGLRRDSAPSRETRKETTTGAGSGVKVCSHWDGDQHPHPTLSQSFNTGGIGQSNQELFSQRGANLVPSCGDIGRTLLAKPNDSLDHTLDTYVCMAHGQGSEEIRTDGGATTLTCNHEAPIVIHGTQDPIVADDIAHCLGRNSGQENAVVTAFSAKDYGADATNNLSPTLRAGSHDKSHANSGNWMAVAIHQNGDGELRETPVAPTLSKGGGKPGQGYSAIRAAMQVRRLTTVECARLQGFPDNHTQIPWRGRPASECPDGPQYKAYGNSMAEPCMRWIGKRIDDQLNDNRDREASCT